MDAGNVISLITGVLGIAGTIGGIVAWMNTQSNKRIADSITRALTPLTYEMKALNTHLDLNAVEHKGFKEQLDEHGDSIHNHDLRISVLEDRGGRK